MITKYSNLFPQSIILILIANPHFLIIYFVTEAEEKNATNLRLLAEKNPNIKNILLEKAEVQEKKYNLIKDEVEFEKLLDQVDSVLKEVEKELSSRDGEFR